ncbi:MAG: hypothetical protein PHF60_04485, partial [Candidatus ainarchaeum sp.]|nr:hypothetical protein [Candidatus ainarchaeum sp.]
AAADAEAMLTLLADAKAEADMKGEAEITWPNGATVKITRNDARVPPKLQEFENMLQAAMAQAENSDAEIGRFTAEMEAADAELTKLKRDLDRHMDKSPENIARGITETFKNRVLMAKERIDDKEISEFLEEAVENSTIVGFLDRAKELLEKREQFAGREAERLVTSQASSEMAEALFSSELKAIERKIARAATGEMTDKRKAKLEVLAANKADIEQKIRKWAEEKADLRKKAELDTLASKKTEFERKVDEFATAVETSDLHETAKTEIKKLAEAMKTYPIDREFIEMQMMGSIRATHAQPLRKVVPFALKEMKKRKDDPFELTDEQKIVMRTSFEAYGTDSEGPSEKQQSWIGRWMNSALDVITNPESYKWMVRLPALYLLPGKQIVGSYNKRTKTYRDRHAHLKPRNMFQHYTWTTKDASGRDITHVSRMPRLLVGAFWATAKGYFVLPALVSLVIGSAEGHWYKPWTWPSAAARAVGLSDGPVYIKDENAHLYYPWTWFLPTESQRDRRLYVEDSYDIAAKLPDRGHEYYKFAYGLGKSLPGEKDIKELLRARLSTEYGETIAAMSSGIACGTFLECGNPIERLNWLQSRPEVLRFLQERSVLPWRRMPMVNTKLHDLTRGAGAKELCSITNRRLPSTCTDMKNAYIGVQESQDATASAMPAEADNAAPTDAAKLVDPAQQTDATMGTWNFIESYEPVRGPENWDKNDKNDKVCCTIAMTMQPIPDKLVLNKAQSDEFIAELMRIEREGIHYTRIDEQGKEWAGTRKGPMTYEFLASPENTARWVKEGFLMTKAEADLIERTSVTNRESIIFLRTQGGSRIDPFVKMCGRIGEADWHIGNDKRNAFVGLWMKKIEENLAGVNLDIAYVPGDVLVATLDSATTEGAANGWVQNTKAEHERWQLNTRLLDLNLETTALDTLVANPDIKSLVERLHSGLNGYYINRSRANEFVQVLAQHKGASANIADFDPSLSGSRVQWSIGKEYVFASSMPAAEGQMDIPRLTDEAKAFYKGQELFSSIVDGGIFSLHQDTKADGKLAKEILWKLFKGDKAKMADSLKQGLYLALATVKDPQAYARESGITLKKDANGKLAGAVIAEGSDEAVLKALRIRMLDTMKRITPTEPMPVPQVTNESRTFYISQPEFADAVNRVISTLHGSGSENGKLMESELGTVFHGEQERMDEVLREWVYLELATCDAPEAYAEATGITVTKTEDGTLTGATIEGKNTKTAEKAIRQRVVELLQWVRPKETPAAQS